MNHHALLQHTLPRLSRRMRAAFAVACAKRVFDVLLDDDRSPTSTAKQALAMIQRFAAGQEIGAPEYEAQYQATAQAQLEAAERQDLEFNYAMRTILEALVTVHRPDSDPAIGAAYNLIDTAAYADRAHADAAEAEEIAWLRAALELAERTADADIRPELFDGLGAMPPEWLLRWERR